MTTSQYYIVIKGEKEGPHDLVTIMRRIHSGKVTFHTPIYMEGWTKPEPAGSIPEIFPFFGKEEEKKEAPKSKSPVPPVPGITKPSSQIPTLKDMVKSGWSFILEHNTITVYAGGLMLLNVMLAYSLVQSFGIITGGVIAWCIFLILHHTYMICVLRLYRRQTIGTSFVVEHLLPIYGKLIVVCIVMALLLLAGWALLIFPGMMLATFYVFVPFTLLDQREVAKAIKSSPKLLERDDESYVSLVGTLVALHLICLLLIIPIPLTLPIFATAMAEIYEELSTS